MRFTSYSLALLLVSCFAALGQTQEDKIPQKDVAFFEQHIRPVFVNRCVKCHGSKKQEGGLRLDSQAAALKGGESGAAITPGKHDDSLLIDAVRYDSLEMPPDGQLSAKEVAAIERWVKIGAPLAGERLVNNCPTQT